MNEILTICTAPKPFVDPHIINIQLNAIRSWKVLGQNVAIVLIGDEEGVEQAATTIGTDFVPNVERNKQGTPLISSLFKIARKF